MEYDEIIKVRVLMSDGSSTIGEFRILEEAPDNPFLVVVILAIGTDEYNESAATHFEAMQRIRRRLEVQGTQLSCYGASVNVYPSPMMLDMGNARMAYVLTMGRSATRMVDIFASGPDVIPSTVEEQDRYHDVWLAKFRT